MAAATAVAGMFTARVLDADPEADPPWLATEFVPGPTLRQAVLERGPLSEVDQLRLARELAEALSAIHAAGLVHRDLKPANVLLSPTGAKVIDFGIAHAVDSTRLTTVGSILGTPDSWPRSRCSPRTAAGRRPMCSRWAPRWPTPPPGAARSAPSSRPRRCTGW